MLSGVDVDIAVGLFFLGDLSQELLSVLLDLSFLLEVLLLLKLLLGFLLSVVEHNGSVTEEALRMVLESQEKLHGCIAVLDTRMSSVLDAEVKMLLN